MQSSRAFSPGHVTGFFSIRPHADPLHHGSLGAGFSVGMGVTTTVTSLGSDKVTLNGEPLNDAPVSRALLRLFRSRTGWKPPVTIAHETDLPVGCGFGTSGAAALSLALALNELANTGLSQDVCGELAHLAELECGTGLGTVLGESHGGFKASLKPGAPGTGVVQPLPSPEGLTSVFVVLGPLATSAMLKNPAIRDAVNREGEVLRMALLKDPRWSEFLRLSERFGRQTKLVGPQLAEIQKKLALSGLMAPMLMFGNGLFTLVERVGTAAAVAAFSQIGEGRVFSCELDPKGGRLLHEN